MLYEKSNGIKVRYWTYVPNVLGFETQIMEFSTCLPPSLCSSVSTVSGYGLDDQAIKVQSAAEARDFSSNFCVETGSGAHPASSQMGSAVNDVSDGKVIWGH
jgi:hypothetical protein